MQTTLKLAHTAKLKSLAAATAITFVGLISATSPATAGEVTTDRCSSRVSFPVDGYDERTARPDNPGAVVLIPPKSGYTPWTSPFSVTKGPDGHVRWWCNSTIGNIFDLGTYRFKVKLPETLQCAAQIVSKVVDGEFKEEDLKCVSDAVEIKAGASEYDGWTPERLRCDDRSNLIRARMGPDRLLQVECLGRVGHEVAPVTSALKSFTPARQPMSICRQFMARDWHRSDTQPIVNFWSPGRLDNSLMFNPSWRSCPGDFESPDYRAFKVEGLVFKSRTATSLPTVALYHYYNPSTNDNATTRSLWIPGLDRDKQPGRGYRLSETAYIVAPRVTPTANMEALYTWYDPVRRDYFTTTQAKWAGKSGDRKDNYIFVRHEGYVLKAE